MIENKTKYSLETDNKFTFWIIHIVGFLMLFITYAGNHIYYQYNGMNINTLIVSILSFVLVWWGTLLFFVIEAWADLFSYTKEKHENFISKSTNKKTSKQLIRIIYWPLYLKEKFSKN